MAENLVTPELSGDLLKTKMKKDKTETGVEYTEPYENPKVNAHKLKKDAYTEDSEGLHLKSAA